LALAGQLVADAHGVPNLSKEIISPSDSSVRRWKGRPSEVVAGPLSSLCIFSNMPGQAVGLGES